MTTIPGEKEFETEVTGHSGMVLVDFYTDVCSPCRMMMPVLAELAGERTDLKIVKVNASANHTVAGRYRVQAVPTFILFNNGEVCGQFTGARSKKALATWIDSNR